MELIFQNHLNFLRIKPILKKMDFFNKCSCNSRTVTKWTVYKEGSYFIYKCTECGNSFKRPVNWETIQKDKMKNLMKHGR